MKLSDWLYIIFGLPTPEMITRNHQAFLQQKRQIDAIRPNYQKKMDEYLSSLAPQKKRR